MKKLLLIGVLLATTLLADSRMISHRDFVDFYLSSQLKEQIKAELIEEMGLSIDQAKEQLLAQIQEESERHRRLYLVQVEEFVNQLGALQEEVEFLRELVVDANYQRNSNDDLLARIQEKLEALQLQVVDLEKIAKDEAQTPPIPQGGQRL